MFKSQEFYLAGEIPEKITGYIHCPSGRYRQHEWKPNICPLYIYHDGGPCSARDAFRGVLSKNPPSSMLLEVLHGEGDYQKEFAIHAVDRRPLAAKWVGVPGMERRFNNRGDLFNTDSPFLIIPVTQVIIFQQNNVERIVSARLVIAQAIRPDATREFTIIGSLELTHHAGIELSVKISKR